MYLAIAKVVILDLYNALAEEDKPYFRESREKTFGKTLEEVSVLPFEGSTPTAAHRLKS